MRMSGSNAPGRSRFWGLDRRANIETPMQAARRWPSEHDLSPSSPIVNKLSSTPNEKELERIDNYRRINIQFNHETPAIRVDAAYSLSKTKDPLAIVPLYKLLYDKNTDVRGAAAESIGLLGTAAWADSRNAEIKNAAAKRLLKLFKNEKEQLATRARAASSMGTIGYFKAVPLLIKSLENQDDEGMHSVIVWALGALPDRKSLPALETTLKLCREGMYPATRHYVEKNAEQAIAKIEGRYKSDQPPLTARITVNLSD
jgi:HEAT repeat protein